LDRAFSSAGARRDWEATGDFECASVAADLRVALTKLQIEVDNQKQLQEMFL
jgi:hypothetical protein